VTIAGPKSGITVGKQIGNYQILALIGAGGMGEVYRARDQRLERDVAIKVLPRDFALDADRLWRFQQEARAAAALNHPGILAIFDFGEVEGCPYVVSELLEGETLRERLRSGQVPPRKAVEYALQMAQGLAAAHEKGIVHRDLKPENIFITGDGRAKILDFGLAKLIVPQQGENTVTSAPTGRTEVGTVMGTVGYMSPEQVRGREVDHRSDIFTFGAILYEMLTGRRAFQGDTAADTASSILKDDPPEMSESGRQIPPGVDSIVRHCLEKNPQERFQSARDLAFDLERLSGLSAPSGSVAAGPEPKTAAWARPAVLAAAALVLLAIAFFAGRSTSATAVNADKVQFNRLTFRRGLIWTARFSNDGQTVVYGGAWEGKPLQVFVTRPESPESRPLGLEDADVLSVSSQGELAILTKHQFIGAFAPIGTLARVPLSGGAPREVLENVQEADWSPDGSQLAVVRVSNEKQTQALEFPIGNVLYKTQGYLSSIRFSPDGKQIAFLDHPGWGDDSGYVSVIDLAGKVKHLASGWSCRGLAWSPDGKEIWYTCSRQAGEAGRALLAVSMSGQIRLLLKDPANLTLQDVSRDGRVLLTHDSERRGIIGLTAGQTQEQDWSWFDRSSASAFSNDGKTVLFHETGESAKPTYQVYLRQTDGSPPVRLGEGISLALSPDKRWALVGRSPHYPETDASERQVWLVPTGAGEPSRVNLGDLKPIECCGFTPDSKHIVLSATEPGKAERMYLIPFGGTPAPLNIDAAHGGFTSDGKNVLGSDDEGKCWLFSLEGKPKQPRVCPSGEIAGSAGDGKTVFVREGGIPALLYRFDTLTGKKQLVKSIAPSDQGGTYLIDGLRVTSDGKYYVYTYRRILSDLYQVGGLR
jgi:Tol biopolymer transport system component